MLALPFQAFAAADMLPRVGHAEAAVATVADARVAVQAAPLAGQPPCHQQMAQDHKASPPQAAPADDVPAGQHDKAKCGTCGACCVGAAMALGLPAVPALAPPSTVSIPFRAGHLPSVDPVLLERPPSSFLA